MKRVVVSGGFDPVHVGHLEMFVQAKKLGSHLTVILNSDRFLKQKKGFILVSPLTSEFIFNGSLALVFFSGLISWYSLISYINSWNV